MAICGRSCCTRNAAIADHFGRVAAEQELRRYRKDGPIPTTRALIGVLKALSVADASLLDIGAGVGAIHHALLDEGAARAVHVDIAPATVDAAREEATRRGHANVRFVTGDFVDFAPEIDDADVVTLDRVICCYRDMERLVELSAAKARRLYGAVYPRDTPWTRLAFPAINILERLRRSKFRVYLHAPTAVEAVLSRLGFERKSLQRTWVWEVAVYERRSNARPQNYA